METTNQKRSGSKEPQHICYILPDVLKSIEKKKMTYILTVMRQHVAATLIQKQQQSPSPIKYPSLPDQQQAQQFAATSLEMSQKRAATSTAIHSNGQQQQNGLSTSLNS